MNGWLSVYKEAGETSFQIVKKVKRLISKKVGHSGTLDPFAKGVLPLAIGNATRTVAYMQDWKKTYDCEIVFGLETDTLDITGKTTKQTNVLPPNNKIQQSLDKFIGVTNQVPPNYSAKKIKGIRAYKMARDGLDFQLKANKINIESIKLLAMKKNHDNTCKSILLSIVCHKGTYIRAFARDLAHSLNSLGIVSSLTRTDVGFFNKENSVSWRELNSWVEDEAIKNITSILHPSQVVLNGILEIKLNYDEAKKVILGQKILLDNFEPSILGQSKNNIVGDDHQKMIKLSHKDQVVALAKISGKYIKPKKVFSKYDTEYWQTCPKHDYNERKEKRGN